MNSYPYVPFEGDLDSLEGAGLVALKEVHEGWYVDYKECAPSPKDLGRHISAFANQHGGWLFLGIKEDPSTMTAGYFPGVPTNEVSSLLVRLREAASAHVSPVPFFETKVINGPASDLGLPAGQAIDL